MISCVCDMCCYHCKRELALGGRPCFTKIQAIWHRPSRHPSIVRQHPLANIHVSFLHNGMHWKQSGWPTAVSQFDGDLCQIYPDDLYCLLSYGLCLFSPCSICEAVIMNPVYSPASTGVPFTNTKGIGYPGNLLLM